jgi:hypothetical protein
VEEPVHGEPFGGAPEQVVADLPRGFRREPVGLWLRETGPTLHVPEEFVVLHRVDVRFVATKRP